MTANLRSGGGRNTDFSFSRKLGARTDVSVKFFPRSFSNYPDCDPSTPCSLGRSRKSLPCYRLRAGGGTIFSMEQGLNCLLVIVFARIYNSEFRDLSLFNVVPRHFKPNAVGLERNEKIAVKLHHRAKRALFKYGNYRNV